MSKRSQLPRGGQVWAGIDAGKAAHHLAVVDGGGQVVRSAKVVNDQAAIEDAIATVTAQDWQVS